MHNNTISNAAEEVIHNITATFDRPLNKPFLTLENPVFGTFMFWTGLLALKMLFMSLLPSIHKLIFKDDTEKLEKKIEIGRSAHRNDMENILPYFTIGLLYVCVNPPPLFATILFRFATIFRYCHTFVYAIYPIPQPARGICFFLHYLIMIYMIIHILVISAPYI